MATEVCRIFSKTFKPLLIVIAAAAVFTVLGVPGLALADLVAAFFVLGQWGGECAIKCSVGNLALPGEFYRIVAEDYGIVGIETMHLEAYGQLPMHHRDPFDRLLIVKAQLGDFTLVTRDDNIARYDVAVLTA